MAERGQPLTEQGTVIVQSGSLGGTCVVLAEGPAAAWLTAVMFFSLALMQGRHVE
jgi:hypothetical protein